MRGDPDYRRAREAGVMLPFAVGGFFLGSAAATSGSPPVHDHRVRAFRADAPTHPVSRTERPGSSLTIRFTGRRR